MGSDVDNSPPPGTEVKNPWSYIFIASFPEALRFKAWVCGRSISWVVGSNPAGTVGVYLLCSLCVVQVEACATNCV